MYVVNGILMLVSFFFCRVMLFPVLFWWYSSLTGLSLVTTFLSLPMWVHVGTLGLWFPQLLWFHKMLRGSVKVLRDQMKRMDQQKTKQPVKPSTKRQSTEELEQESMEKLCQKLD